MLGFPDFSLLLLNVVLVFLSSNLSPGSVHAASMADNIGKMYTHVYFVYLDDTKLLCILI